MEANASPTRVTMLPFRSKKPADYFRVPRLTRARLYPIKIQFISDGGEGLASATFWFAAKITD